MELPYIKPDTTSQVPINFPTTYTPIKYTNTPNQRSSIETGRYLVVRKDGKVHFEKFNGTGWAYNNETIEFYYLPKIN